VTHHSKIFKKNTCNIEYIPPSFLHKLLRIFKRRPHPRTRNVLQKNKDRLLDFDALVLTDRHFINGSGKQPSYIFVGHGAGDRAKGYTDAVKNFDYILLSGKEKWNRMSELISISHNNGRIIGYPKFDLVSSQDTKSRWFKNNNPVVLYNPHFNKSETSWFLWGKQILDFFLSNKQYNLIFAPHLILFSKQKNPIDPKYHHSENIHIDVNSHALIDMTYTITSDIYLGDVSSQVYEFVGFKKRPCLFLNTHQSNWQGNRSFRMWNMGPVIDHISEFEGTLAKIKETHVNFQKNQTELVNDTFSITDQLAGKRGSQAIVEFLKSQYE